IRAPGLADSALEFSLRSYSPGSRATFEVCAGDRRVAVKAYAEDPSPEAELYEALAAAGLAGDSGVRVAPLLTWDRDLRVLVNGWLEGPTANQLVKCRQGRRAGELAARWFQRAASLPVKLGPPVGAADVMDRARTWVATLSAADPALGADAVALAESLARTQPNEGTPRLVHGTLYARHILDLGDGPGVIDWQRFGQGPLEFDAGTFLATISRSGLLDKTRETEAVQAQEAFLAGTAGLLDGRSLAWHQAAVLLRLASKQNRRHDNRWRERAYALLGEATRLL
ncbi:MAG TPA: phosphotransferase, partial [Verrucomicrobiae bacterium]|nr:phosphotransferase [Verrucomicrobiae bacterium]